VVLNFYAPWCPWCQRLEPTWEAVTQEIHKRYPESDGRIRFGKVLSTLHEEPDGAPWTAQEQKAMRLPSLHAGHTSAEEKVPHVCHG